MIAPPDSENTLTQTLNYLVQLQKELRKMLRDCAISEPIAPRHSLYSSKRVFRADELHLGLRNFGVKPDFSIN